MQDNIKEINTLSIESINKYLLGTNLLIQGEKVINTSVPGEGNMNLVLRLYTSKKRTLIFKKSFNYVKKYPQVSAPINRVNMEVFFYELIKNTNEVAQKTPSLLFHDKKNNVVIFEDLGDSKDYSFLYNLNEKLNEAEFNSLIDFLISLHKVPKQKYKELDNIEMRKLNHEHIFSFPFNVDNGFDLNLIQEGLADLALSYQKDEELKELIKLAGEKYLENGKKLLHGDFYPGSWLKTKEGIKIIDAEFAFHGCAEFDLAILVAHCKMTNQEESLLFNASARYKEHHVIDDKLVNSFVGIEIFRRLIGLAQLPLNISLNKKKELLEKAYGLVINN